MSKRTGNKNNLYVHGGHSLVKKYRENKLDRRTSIGRYIADMKKSIIEDIGDPSPPQQILLELITQKILFIKAIADYCNEQGRQIVDGSGVLLPCLSKNYLAFSNSLVRDLKVLYEFEGIKKEAVRESEDDGYLRAVMGGVDSKKQTQ
jgi:hypothetical protein